MHTAAGYHASPAAKTTTMFSACVRLVSMSCVCVSVYKLTDVFLDFVFNGTISIASDVDSHSSQAN